MINITRNEEVVLSQIEIFDVEYPDGIPLNVLRKDLGFHEYDLVQILEELQDKDLIVFKDNKASLSESEKEINTVNSRKDIEELELNMKERESYKLIQELVDDKNLISKYTLEGHLLYGDLKWIGNSFMTAFEPILNYVTPALDFLIEKLVVEILF